MDVKRTFQRALRLGLGIVGPGDVGFRNLDPTLRAEVLVDDLSHLTPPVPASLFVWRVSGTPGAGNAQALRYTAPPQGAVIVDVWNSNNNDMGLEAGPLAGFTASLGPLTLSTGVNLPAPPEVGPMGTIQAIEIATPAERAFLQSTDHFGNPFFLPGNHIFQVTAAADATPADPNLMVQEYPSQARA